MPHRYSEGSLLLGWKRETPKTSYRYVSVGVHVYPCSSRQSRSALTAPTAVPTAVLHPGPGAPGR